MSLDRRFLNPLTSTPPLNDEDIIMSHDKAMKLDRAPFKF